MVKNMVDLLGPKVVVLLFKLSDVADVVGGVVLDGIVVTFVVVIDVVRLGVVDGCVVIFGCVINVVWTDVVRLCAAVDGVVTTNAFVVLGVILVSAVVVIPESVVSVVIPESVVPVVIPESVVIVVIPEYVVPAVLPGSVVSVVIPGSEGLVEAVVYGLQKLQQNVYITSCYTVLLTDSDMYMYLNNASIVNIV